MLTQLAPIMRLDCVYCGAPATRDRLNGVDRVDNTGEYEHGNCASCCTTCNFMKGKLDIAMFLNHVEKIAANLRNARYNVSRVLCEQRTTSE